MPEQAKNFSSPVLFFMQIRLPGIPTPFFLSQTPTYAYKYTYTHVLSTWKILIHLLKTRINAIILLFPGTLSTPGKTYHSLIVLP